MSDTTKNTNKNTKNTTIKYTSIVSMTEETLREMLKDIGDTGAYQGRHWQFSNTYGKVDDEKLGGEISDIIERYKDEITFSNK